MLEPRDRNDSGWSKRKFHKIYTQLFYSDKLRMLYEYVLAICNMSDELVLLRF